MAKPNPRRANGVKRTALRNRVKAMGLPCHICGRPIDYSLTTYVDPKDGRTKRHPLSYELDELVPVSKGGSPFDIDNVAPAHRICNQRRGNKTMPQKPREAATDPLPKSRCWD
jgi:5-methylcytosine-specific restriction endonuclease McrA